MLTSMDLHRRISGTVVNKIKLKFHEEKLIIKSTRSRDKI